VWEGNKRIPRGFPVKLRREAVASKNVLAMISNDFKFPVQTPDIAYVVEKGDSLSVIARRFSTSVTRLVSLNQLTSRNRIQIGQRLLLPQDDSNPVLLASASLSSDGLYSIRRGDTVSVIAARYGVTEQALMRVNGISDPRRIYPGQQIALPGFQSESVLLAVNDAVPAPDPLQLVNDLEAPAAESAATKNITTASSTRAPSVSQIESLEDASLEDAPVASSVQLALNETVLPPAAVLPDNQELETPVTLEDGQAVALDPALDVAESNEQLTEALAADPSDYSVASNNTVEIQASETLGHYADWLGIRAWDVRRLNNMAFRDQVIIGKRLSLDFSRVNIVEFEQQRREFHSTLQREFFANYRIQDVEQYQLRRRDNIGRIARNDYSTPIWLLRQYNPGLDFNRIQIGQQIVFPLLERVR
jgi:membrane-bound lytic murein transglycosylase D